MTIPNYLKASSRSDLSQWVVHLVRIAHWISPTQFAKANEIFINILAEGQIRPSMVEQITRYAPQGATCFYDVPPAVWSEVISTNPNARQPLGFCVQKSALWYLGGRPVIYTDQVSPEYWPEEEKYRVVYTNLLKLPQPIDWTHEREWRIRGPLILNQPNIPYTWWWPIVPSDDWLPYIWQAFPSILQVYVMSRNACVDKTAIKG